MTTNGESEYTFDVSTIEATNTWVQVGVFVRLTSGTTPKNALVRLWSSVLGAGWVVGRAKIDMQASQTNIIPVGAPFSAADVSEMRIGISFIGVVGGVTDPDIAYRTFEIGNPTYPDGGWTAGGNTTDAAAGNSKVLYDVSTTTANKMLIQPGFKYSTTASQYGVAMVIVVARRK